MSTTPPRNVIYCNDPGSLTEIAGMAYTDIILNFLAPGPDGNLTGPAPTPEQVQAMQNVGKNVLISLGGDPKTFASSDWQNYANDVNGLVQQVVAFVTSNGLNGVDIDYEDDNGFSTRDKNGNWAGPPVYDGVQLLIDLTNGLAQQLPPGSIITHAPQPPYFDPDAGYNPPGGTAPYTQIWEAAGNNISWVNCQFYNNSSYDDPADTKVASYGTIVGITSAPKLLVGAPVAAAAATSGYLPLDQFTSQVIGPLRQQYPGSFGGVTGWAFLYDQGGTWADGVGLALHQQHMFYIGTDSNVHHAYSDPATGFNADQWTHDGQAGGELATLAAGAQQHVFYVGADGNVHHVYWDPTAGINADQWTTDAQAVSNLATLAAGAQQHVFFTGSDKNVHHLYWDPAATGIIANQWTSDGQAAGPLATLLTA